MQHTVQFVSAIQVGITIPEIQGTTDLPPETTLTETIPTPAPVMTMAQCQEDTGNGYIFKN